MGHYLTPLNADSLYSIDDIYENIISYMGVGEKEIFEKEVIDAVCEMTEIMEIPIVENVVDYIDGYYMQEMESLLFIFGVSEEEKDYCTAKYLHNVACYYDVMIKNVLIKNGISFMEAGCIRYMSKSCSVNDNNVLLPKF